MNIEFLKSLFIISTLLCLVAVQGCESVSHQESSSDIPVSWQSGFVLPDLLASNIKLTGNNDLGRLIDAPWYTEISVSNTKTGESVFASCSDYFEKVLETTRTTKENEMGPYLEFKIMCEAVRILISSNESKWTYLSDLVLSESLPSLLPKEIALQTSLEESKRNAKEVALVYWEDITPITKYEYLSATKSIYHHNGGYQELEIVGWGDTNNDFIEDVIVVVRDYVEGGSYMNIRLLVLSVSSKGNWALIKEV